MNHMKMLGTLSNEKFFSFAYDARDEYFVRVSTIFSLLLRFGNLQLTDFNTLLSHSKLQGVLWKVFDAGVRLEYVFFCLVLSTCYSSQQFSLNTFAQLSLLAPTELQQAILLA